MINMFDDLLGAVVEPRMRSEHEHPKYRLITKRSSQRVRPEVGLK